jgi:hypothetical protein
MVQGERKIAAAPTGAVLANHHRAGSVDPVHLKHALRNIQPDRGNLHSGRLLFVVAFSDDHVMAPLMPEGRGRPPHHLHRPWRASDFNGLHRSRRSKPKIRTVKSFGASINHRLKGTVALAVQVVRLIT